MDIKASISNHELLSKYLDKYAVSEATIDFLVSKVTSERLYKGEVFTSAGKTCDKIGILINGLLYASYIPENGIDEIVSRFFYIPKNAVVTSFESFSRMTPSRESIIVLEDSFLICISKSDLNKAYQLSPAVERLGRVIAEESYIEASDRSRALQILNTTDRILHFRRAHPELVNRASIQQQQVASYLGMNRNIYTRNANKC